jgi:hypothetical protein
MEAAFKMKLLAYAPAIAGRLVPIFLCAAAIVCVGVTSSPQHAHAGTPSATLALDLDVSDGVCTDIDTARSVPHPTTGIQVGVCFSLPSNADPVAAFRYAFVYDDSVIVAPEVADAGTALEDNPDANDGTEFSTPGLGGGWDCNPVGVSPRGDTNGATGAGNGRFFSGGCASNAGATLLANSGFAPLGVVTFNTVGGGSSTIAIDPNGNVSEPGATVTGDSLEPLGSCSPVTTLPMACNGGTITVTGAPTSTPVVPTNTPTVTSTPQATSSAQPTKISNQSSHTPTPSPTGEATAVPGTQAPGTTPPAGGASPTRTGTGQPGAGVTGPDTGGGPGNGSGGTDTFALVAAAGALFLAAGGGLAWRRRCAKSDA